MRRRHFLLTLLLLLALANWSFATDISLSTFQIKDWNWGGATLKLRLYSIETWTDSLGYVRGAGVAGSSTGFFKEITCSVSGTTATCPSSGTIVIPSTLDSIDRPQVRITGSLIDSQNRYRANLFQNWVIPASPTPTTWQALVTYNRAQPRPLADVYYNAAQVDAKIQAALSGGAPLATELIPGKARLSQAAASVSDPIVVGANDTRLGVVAQCAGIDDTAGVAAAVTTAAGGFVTITRGQTCAVSGTPTIPALRVEKGGLLKPLSAAVVTINSLDAGRYQVFTNALGLAGQGRVLLTSVDKFYPEWWGGGFNDGVTDEYDIFRAGIDSTRFSTTNFTGITLSLGPKTYYLRRKLSINLSMLIDGVSPGGQYPKSLIKCNGATGCLLFEGDGTAYIGTGYGQFSQVHNVGFVGTLQIPTNPNTGSISAHAITITAPASGTANTANNVVTRVSGTSFDTKWNAGMAYRVGGSDYEIESVDSASQITLAPNKGTVNVSGTTVTATSGRPFPTGAALAGQTIYISTVGCTITSASAATVLTATGCPAGNGQYFTLINPVGTQTGVATSGPYFNTMWSEGTIIRSGTTGSQGDDYYEVDASSVTATTLTFRPVRGTVSATGATINWLLGNQFRSSWVGQTITINGTNYTVATVSEAGAGNSSMTVTPTPTNLIPGSVYTYKLIDVGVQASTPIIPQTAHGITATGRADLEHIWVRNVNGDAIHIEAGARTNANSWHMTRVWVDANGGNGIYVKGNDTSVGNCEACYSGLNKGAGFLDLSFLGNTYNTAHADLNNTGSYKMLGVVANNVVHGSYIESGSPPEYSGATVVLGGTAYDQTSPAFFITSSPTGGILNHWRYRSSTFYNNKQVHFGVGAGDSNLTAYSLATSDDGATFNGYNLRYDAAGLGWFGWNHSGDVTNTYSMSGNSAPEGRGHFRFDRGFFLGSGATQRFITNGTAPPAVARTQSGFVDTSGTAVTWITGAGFTNNWAGTTITINGVGYTVASAASNKALTLTGSAGVQTAVAYSINDPYKVGEVFLNTGATSGGPAGWICVVAGNPGTWQPFGLAVTTGNLLNGEGAVLSVSSNAVVPTHLIHHVGAGLIKNITLPTGFTAGTIWLIPDAAFTTDTTGNIGLASTAVAGKAMAMACSSSSNKCYPSY